METRTRRRATGAAVLRADLTDSIVDAVLDELADKGYGRLSMDGVARRAGVGKSALYRRWPSKQDMAIDVVSRMSLHLAEFDVTGTLQGDIRSMLDALLDWFQDPRLGRIIPDLVAEAQRNDALATALTTAIDTPRRDRGGAILDRAIERGDLPVELDKDLALDLLAGPVFWRLAVRRMSVTPGYLDAATEAMVAMLRTASRRTSGPTGSGTGTS